MGNLSALKTVEVKVGKRYYFRQKKSFGSFCPESWSLNLILSPEGATDKVDTQWTITYLKVTRCHGGTH